MTYGFQSGTSGSSARVCWRNGWNMNTESVCSRFEPSSGTSAGRLESQGVPVQR
jgi:hypothetical protein